MTERVGEREEKIVPLRSSGSPGILQPGGGIAGASDQERRIADRVRQVAATPGQKTHDLASIHGQVNAVVERIGQRAEATEEARVKGTANLVRQADCDRLTRAVGPRDSTPDWLVAASFRFGMFGLGITSAASMAGCVSMPPTEIIRENTEPTVDPVIEQALKDKELREGLATGEIVFAAAPNVKDPGLTSKPVETQTPTPEAEATVGKEINITVFDGVGGGGEKTFTIGGVSPSPENGEPWEKTNEWSKIADGLISASLREIEPSATDILAAVGFYDGENGKGSVSVYAISSDTEEVRLKSVAVYNADKEDKVIIYTEDDLSFENEDLVFGSDAGRFYQLKSTEENEGVTFPQLALEDGQVVAAREFFWPEAEFDTEKGEWGSVDWEGFLAEREISLDIGEGVELPTDIDSEEYQDFSESLRQAFLEVRDWQREKQQAGEEDYTAKIRVTVNSKGEIEVSFGDSILEEATPVVVETRTPIPPKEEESTPVHEKETFNVGQAEKMWVEQGYLPDLRLGGEITTTEEEINGETREFLSWRVGFTQIEVDKEFVNSEAEFSLGGTKNAGEMPVLNSSEPEAAKHVERLGAFIHAINLGFLDRSSQEQEYDPDWYDKFMEYLASGAKTEYVLSGDVPVEGKPGTYTSEELGAVDATKPVKFFYLPPRMDKERALSSSDRIYGGDSRAPFGLDYMNRSSGYYGVFIEDGQLCVLSSQFLIDGDRLMSWEEYGPDVDGFIRIASAPSSYRSALTSFAPAEDLNIYSWEKFELFKDPFKGGWKRPNISFGG